MGLVSLKTKIAPRTTTSDATPAAMPAVRKKGACTSLKSIFATRPS